MASPCSRARSASPLSPIWAADWSGGPGKPLHLAALLVDHDQEGRVVAGPGGVLKLADLLLEGGLVARDHDHAAEPALPDAPQHLLARARLADLADDRLPDHALQRQRLLLLFSSPSASDQRDQADDDEQGDSAAGNRLAPAHLRRQVAVAPVLAGWMRPPRDALVLARAPSPLRGAGGRPALPTSEGVGLKLGTQILAELVADDLALDGQPELTLQRRALGGLGLQRLALGDSRSSDSPSPVSEREWRRRSRGGGSVQSKSSNSSSPDQSSPRSAISLAPPASPAQGQSEIA